MFSSNLARRTIPSLLLLAVLAPIMTAGSCEEVAPGEYIVRDKILFHKDCKDNLRAKHLLSLEGEDGALQGVCVTREVWFNNDIGKRYVRE